MSEIKDGQIISKAYRVYHDGILYDDYGHDQYIIDNQPIVYGGTAGEVKSHGLCLERGSLDREVKFTDIKTKRVRDYDVVYFEGEETKRWQMESELNDRENINKMKSHPDDECFYVQDARNYVGNAVLWWGINGNGYVTDLKKAHKYTKEEVIKQFGRGRDTDIVWPASHVETAIREYVDMQGLDRSLSI